jgi:hypothetical protein
MEGLLHDNGKGYFEHDVMLREIRDMLSEAYSVMPCAGCHRGEPDIAGNAVKWEAANESKACPKLGGGGECLVLGCFKIIGM